MLRFSDASEADSFASSSALLSCENFLHAEKDFDAVGGDYVFADGGNSSTAQESATMQQQWAMDASEPYGMPAAWMSRLGKKTQWAAGVPIALLDTGLSSSVLARARTVKNHAPRVVLGSTSSCPARGQPPTTWSEQKVRSRAAPRASSLQTRATAPRAPTPQSALTARAPLASMLPTTRAQAFRWPTRCSARAALQIVQRGSSSPGNAPRFRTPSAQRAGRRAAWPRSRSRRATRRRTGSACPTRGATRTARAVRGAVSCAAF